MLSLPFPSQRGSFLHNTIMLLYLIAGEVAGEIKEDIRQGQVKKNPGLSPGISIKNNFYQLWLIVYASDFSDLLLFEEFFKVKISF